jgi:hypothetical protein
MSTWVNAADHDCTLGLNRGRPDTVLCCRRNYKKVTLRELGHIWSDRSRLAALDSSGFFSFSAFNADGETLH